MIVEMILNKQDDEGNIAFFSDDVKSITMKGRALAIHHGNEGKIFYASKGNIKCMVVKEEEDE